MDEANRSRSLQEFEDDWKTVEDFLGNAPPQEEQLASRENSRLAYTIYCSCVLLLSSYLEKFIESLIVESIDLINSANLRVDQVPTELRISQVRDELDNLHIPINKRKTISSISNLLNKSQKVYSDFDWFLDKNRVHTKFSAVPIVGENRFSSPSPDKIEEVFKHLGIKSIIGKVVGLDNQIDKVEIPKKVKEMVDKRNDIAHTGGTIPVTEQDIKDYLNYSMRLVAGLEKITSRELNKLQQNICLWG